MPTPDVAAKAIDSNPTKEGTIVTLPAKNGSLTNRIYDGYVTGGIDPSGLQDKYKDSFDDNRYYTT